MFCSGAESPELIRKTIGLLEKVTQQSLVKKCKIRYNRDLNDCADFPDKFCAAIKKLYPAKLPLEQGSASVINGVL